MKFKPLCKKIVLQDRICFFGIIFRRIKTPYCSFLGNLQLISLLYLQSGTGVDSLRHSKKSQTTTRHGTPSTHPWQISNLGPFPILFPTQAPVSSHDIDVEKCFDLVAMCVYLWTELMTSSLGNNVVGNSQTCDFDVLKG